MSRKTFLLTRDDALGEKNNFAKLTEEDIRKIRELKKTNNLTQIKIAKQFNISQSTVSRILSGSRWRQVL